MKNKKVVTIGNTTLYLGDCFKVLPKLGMKFDTVISDPPFGLTNCPWDNAIPLDKFWEMLDHCTKQNATFVLFGCGGFTVDLINSKRNWYRYDMVWVKSKKCGHLNANLMPMRNHEQILVFGRPGFKKQTIYIPQKTLGGRVGIITRNHKSSIYRDTGECVHTSDGTVHPSSVLTFASERGQHPTQKPVDLTERLVRTYSDEGGTVLDCFMGSGSTAIACVRAGRAFIGIEQDREYFNLAVERVKKAYAERNEGK
jgi:site-specific DNA-methyltransferase (adenine-specific)